MAVCRKTFGYHKKEDEISLSQLVGMTGMAKPTVIRAVESLSERDNPLLVVNRESNTNTYRLLVTNFDQSGGEVVTECDYPEVVKIFNRLDPEMVTFFNTQKKDLLNIIYKITRDELDGVSKQIDNLDGEDREIAEIILQHHNKQKEDQLPDDDWAIEEAKLLRDAIRSKGSYGQTHENRVGVDTVLTEWATEIRRLATQDGYDPGTIQRVLRYIREQNDFWIPKGALRSATSLRTVSKNTKQTKFEMMHGNYRGSKESQSTKSFWEQI